ncbi:hypothetical protein D5S17_24350 [Pseudonocardiaceae bacterium YIM PH 21723]|nr:hypothetical protein D5S17_24350 [Pseudonocardiaceae bacterium YIM PH 21723]
MRPGGVDELLAEAQQLLYAVWLGSDAPEAQEAHGWLEEARSKLDDAYHFAALAAEACAKIQT